MLSLPISSLRLGKNKMAAPIIFRPDKASQLLITTQFCGYLALICYQCPSRYIIIKHHEQ